MDRTFSIYDIWRLEVSSLTHTRKKEMFKRIKRRNFSDQSWVSDGRYDAYHGLAPGIYKSREISKCTYIVLYIAFGSFSRRSDGR